jgi:hypothetical protein
MHSIKSSVPLSDHCVGESTSGGGISVMSPLIATDVIVTLAVATIGQAASSRP